MKVKQAFQQIDQDYYVLQENGNMLPQTTRAGAIENGLCMLDVQKGQRVLEIGTGSGYSSALLALLVGKMGQVVSMDIDPKLTQRAKHKLSAYSWVTCVTGDGREGYESTAPYDRIIAWTTPDYFPNSWIDQLKENGFIVAPFRVLDIVQCTVMVRFKNIDSTLQGDLVRPEGYIPMTSEPVVDFDLFGPEAQADVVGEGDSF
jgi:protein-L-isoaspartate(D-aspartate) O-methyltransferase